MASLPNCLFCKIAKGEIPCTNVYEDKDVLAFLDIAPVHKGHTLVIPKQHFETIIDTPDEVITRVMHSVKKISAAVEKAVNADGFNIFINNRRHAGQAVDHVHVHIVPRHQGDGFKHWPQGKYAEGEAEQVKAKIAKFL